MASTGIDIQLSKENEAEDHDSYVEHLRKKYIIDQKSSTNESTRPNSSIGIISCTPSSALNESERNHYLRAMEDLKKQLFASKRTLSEARNGDNLPSLSSDKLYCPDSKARSVSSFSHITGQNCLSSSLKNPSTVDLLSDSRDTLTQSATLPTLSSSYTPRNSSKGSKSVRISLEPASVTHIDYDNDYYYDNDSKSEYDAFTSATAASKLDPADIKAIHSELMLIHRKLNQRKKELCDFEMELETREHLVVTKEDNLLEREQTLLDQEGSIDKARRVMSRLQDVECHVQDKMAILQRYHNEEMDRLKQVIEEKNREFKRLKNSFEVLKSQNDDVKLQMHDSVEKNEKLQIQNNKLRKRLENLMRKNEYQSQKKTKGKILAEQQNKVEKVESNHCFNLNRSLDKTHKVGSNVTSALSVTLEWLCESHLKPVITARGCQIDPLFMSPEYLTDKCLKVLPMLVEVTRSLPSTVSNQQQLTFLSFIYFALHHLEDSHQALLSSTTRRIGEELMKASGARTVADKVPLETSVLQRSTTYSTCATEGKENSSNKPKVFFRSSNTEVRIVSAFIILKTLHQVDMLAQVFDQLKRDLKHVENREIFIDYVGFHTILPYVTYKTNKALLGSAVDVLLQMAMESNHLLAYLEQCSCEKWFKAVSSCIRSMELSTDVSSLEKLSIILQKLSKIKSNRKLFDSFSLGRMLQDRYRDCSPEHTFLAMNLRSILTNLGMLKTPQIADT